MTAPAKRASYRLQALAVALAVLAPAAPAAAGAKLVETPAEKFVTAPGGVDLRTGRFVYEEGDLSIGGEGNAGLSFSRTLTATVPGHSNPFGNLSHNWDIMVSERRLTIDNPEATTGQDFQINVHFGGRSMTYNSRSNHVGYQQMSPGTPAPLTYAGDRAGAAVYTYTAADGTMALFRPIGTGECSTVRRCAYVSEIVETDGTKFTFSYVAAGAGVRLTRVTSSRGFALLLEGSGQLVSKACLLNLAVTAAPGNGLCPADIPAATYSYTGDNRIAAATGPDNATSQFQYGSNTIGFVKPGYTAPWLTNSTHIRIDEIGVPQEIVDHQAYAEGQSYSYKYYFSPYVSYKEATLAGGSYSNALGEGGEATYDWPIAPYANYPGSTCWFPPCSAPMPDGPINDPSFVYQQTPGPVEISAEGGGALFNFCSPAAMAGLPANERNRCVVEPNAQFVVDAEGIRTDLKYDGNGNAVEAKRSPKPGVPNPDGSVPAPIVTTAQYVTTPGSKAVNKPLWMKDARGNMTSWTYAPEHGGMLTETGPAVNPGSGSGAGSVTPQKRYTYVQRTARLVDGSAAGPPVWLLDRMSMCRTGNPSGAGCALGTADEVLTTYDYGPDGGPTNLLLRGQAVTADGQTLRTCFAYDGLGRKISETSPNGTSGLSSCPTSPPTSALPWTTSIRFDADGRVTGTIAPDPDGAGPLPSPAVRNSYDSAGRLIQVEQGALAAWQANGAAPALWPGFADYKVVQIRYDALDRKTREAVGGAGIWSAVTETGYDLAGRVQCTAVRMNPDAWATVLPNKCVPGPAHAVHGADRISKNVYDSAGRLIETWEGVGTPFARREAHYTYNGNRQKLTLTDARGFLAEMKYDGFGRQQRWIFPSKTSPGVADPNDYEQYLYDVDGNRLSLRKRDGKILLYHYDALNRLVIKQTPGHVADVRYDYDLRGLQTRAWYTGNDWGVANAYDGFGRLVSTTTSMAGFSRTVSHKYDLEGRETELTFPDGQRFWTRRDGLGRAIEHYQGPLGSTSTIMTAFAFDAASRLARFSRRFGDATVYEYDGIGRLASLNDAFGGGGGGDTRSTFLYDPASQLRSETRTNDSYAWTASLAANRGYATNGQNQYTGTTTGAAYGYDPNGNLISAVNPPLSTSYVYDAENRLISASGTENATLTYDPLGRLFQISNTAGTTQFLYDGDELIAEYNASGNLLRRYVHGDSDDDPLFWFEGAGLDQPRFPHTNRQGSVTGTAGPGGALLGINTYDEYGIRGAGNTGRFQYTGQAWLPELGMYYYKARIYSPTLGRFLQVDPIGYDDQINLYAYVGNDPISRNDPTGRDAIINVTNGNQVHIILPVTYGGAADSSVARANFERNIVNAYQGEKGVYNVIVEVRAPLASDSISGNSVNFENLGPNTPSTVAGGRNAIINLDSPGISQGTEAHEGGHLMGNPDRYTDNGLTGAARVTTSNPGFEGNIMGALGPKQTVDQRDITGAITAPNNDVTYKNERIPPF